MSALPAVTTSLASLGYPTVAPAFTAPAANAPAQNAQPAAQAGVAAPAAGNAAIATGYNPAPVSTSATGGGLVLDAINKGIQDFGNLVGISRMVAQSSSRVDNVNKQMEARMAATGGQLSPTEMQMFSQQMSLAETTMQMAKNIQDKQDQINQIWARA